VKPNKQVKIDFINDCGCVVDFDVLEKAMIWFSSGNLKSPRKIYMHAKYPCVSIFDKKIHVHRLIGLYLWEDSIVDGMIVHHKDHDKLNSTISNLDVISNAIHGSHHNKGKSISEEHKRKISDAGKKRKGMKMKKMYNIPEDQLLGHIKNGLSISKISRIYGCSWSVVKSRINDIHENKELLK